MLQEAEKTRPPVRDSAGSGRKAADSHPGRPVKTFPGFRWIVSLVTVGLVAGAGCWWLFSTRDDKRAGEAKLEITGQGHRERIGKSKAANPTIVELLQKSFDEKLDEREQWQSVRRLSEEDVKEAIAELRNPEWRSDFSSDFSGDFSSDLPKMLFYRWGELDPVSANEAAKIMFPEGFSGSRQAVIAAWIKRGDATAAWDAVREEGEMWACTRSVPGEVAEMVVASLSDQDDAAAFTAVQRLNDENCMIADVLCHARAGRASTTPETRLEFLAAAAAHPKPYVLTCARECLFREWAKTDVQAAEAGLIALPIPQNEKDRVQYWISSAREDKELDAAARTEASTGPESAARESEGKNLEESPWREVKEQIKKRWEISPAVRVDFELRDETRRLLEDTPLEDLEVWLRESQSHYEGDYDQDILLQLREMVLTVLAPRGAGTLIRSLAEHPVEGGEEYLDEAMDCWTKQDPAAVLKWLGGDVPEAIKEDLDDYRENAHAALARK